MTAFDNNPDPRYTIAIRVFNYNGTNSSAEIPSADMGRLTNIITATTKTSAAIPKISTSI